MTFISEFKYFAILFQALILACCLCASTSILAAAGKEKSKVCAACHGAGGISPNDIWPNLAGQKFGYLVKTLKAYRAGDRNDPVMSPLAIDLTDEDIIDLATYYSRLSTDTTTEKDITYSELNYGVNTTLLRPEDAVSVAVVVPNDHSLQYMNFWIALGAGHFQAENIHPEVLIPSAYHDASQVLIGGVADIAVLTSPLYLSLIEKREAIVVFARLLQNDSVNLVVRKDVVTARKIDPEAPLLEKLKAMRGLRIGVAAGPRSRLRALFEYAGMDIDTDIEMVITPGHRQNKEFGNGKIDALYAHTPYVETALVDQGAVMIVNQSAGEFAPLADPERMLHAMVTTREYAEANPDIVRAVTRAVYRAQALVHTDQKAAVEAIFNAGLKKNKKHHIAPIVSIYAPAIPDTPAVSVKGLKIAQKYYPSHKMSLDLTGINLKEYLAPEFAKHLVKK